MIDKKTSSDISHEIEEWSTFKTVGAAVGLVAFAGMANKVFSDS